MYASNYEQKKGPKIYVSNLNYLTTEEDMHKYFDEFGKVVDVILKRKEPITFAFVQFQEMKAAQAAVEAMNRKSINGCEIRVEFAKGDRRKFDSSRGGDRPRGQYGDRPRGCFNCGEEGHMARECDKPRKPREYGNEGGYRGGRQDEERSYKPRDDRRERRKPSESKSRSRSGDKKKKQRRRKSSSSGSRS